MKTALIYSEDYDLIPQFFVIDGDYRHLNNVFINGVDQDETKTDALNSLMYSEDGKHRHTPVTLEQFAAAIREGAEPIVCGFLP